MTPYNKGTIDMPSTSTSYTPEQIIKRFCLSEDIGDPRWADSPKHVWRGSRSGHGVKYADPTGDWGSVSVWLSKLIGSPE